MKSLLDEDIIQYRKSKPKSHTNSWALSYGDVVTTLLCFFIIFYALEKRIEKNQSNQVKGYGQSEGILKEHKVDGIDVEFDYAIETLKAIPGIQFYKTSQFVDLDFKQTAFFKSGETELTDEGKHLMNDVVKRLSGIKGKYIIEIQGHSDSTQVKANKSRWWKSNMQLSVLRALNVHAYLADGHIDPDSLVVSGHGSQRKISDGIALPEDINRRISLRVHLVK
jgi:flagellar motor protein MotB